MTTKVIVRSPKNNHKAVEVRIVNLAGEVAERHPIPDGEERSFYVYPGHDLRVVEVEK